LIGSSIVLSHRRWQLSDDLTAERLSSACIAPDNELPDVQEQWKRRLLTPSRRHCDNITTTNGIQFVPMTFQ
jgi:hypothetical protein